MVTLVSTLLFGCLLQGAPHTFGDVLTATSAADASLVETFNRAIAEKQWDSAEAQVVTLVGHYRLTVQLQKKMNPNGDQKTRDLAAMLQRSRKSIVAALERAVEDPHAEAAKLQETILGKFGAEPDEGEKLAVKALDMKHFVDVPAVQAAAITALGSLRNPKYAALFEGHLRDSRADVRNAAVHALGEYFGEKEVERKGIVGVLVFAYVSVETEQSKNPPPRPPPAVPASNAAPDVGHEFQIALSRLTGGVQFDRAGLWSDWYRDAKSTKWQDGLEKVSIPPVEVQPGPRH
jgi:HEAT repeat protein